MSKDRKDPIFLKEYFEAQCSFHEGKLTESLKLLQHSLNELRVVIQVSKPIWERTYVNCALLYAQNLDYLNKFDEEYAIFQELLEFSPYEFYLGEYAIFLHKRKKDYNNAEKYYIKSLELFPYQASIHLKYAGFLRYIRNDLVNAEVHYNAAVDVNPESSETVGNYSSFLHSIRNIEKAEIMYQRAVDIDQSNINNLCNYGLLLSEERHRYHLAEDYYKLALKVSDNKHSNTLYNYAVMLDTHCNRKPEAESLYRQAIQIEPRHSYALYNLAVLLEDKEKYRNTHLNVADSIIAESKDGKDSSQHQKSVHAHNNKDITNDGKDDKDSSSFQYSFPPLSPSSSSSPQELTQEILSLYQRAHRGDPQDATIAADYGRYLLMQYNVNTAVTFIACEDDSKNNNKTNNNNSNSFNNNNSDIIDAAEVALATALKIDPKSEVALFNMGVLLQRRKHLTLAESMMERMLDVNPTHPLALLQLARVRTDIIDTVEEKLKLYTRVRDESHWTAVEDVLLLYERVVPLLKESRQGLLEYINITNRYGNETQQIRAAQFQHTYNTSATSNSVINKNTSVNKNNNNSSNKQEIIVTR